MKKLINLLIKIFMCIIYCPYWAVAKVMTIIRNRRYAHKGIKTFEFNFENLISLPFIADDFYKDGEYTIFILKDHRVPGIVCVVEKMKTVLIGHEMADEFMEDTLLARSILLHEKGHVEALGGSDRTHLWYNPEDWVYNRYTPAEMAADKWAIEHGADGQLMLDNLNKLFWRRPITAYCRMQNIRRCMAK